MGGRGGWLKNRAHRPSAILCLGGPKSRSYPQKPASSQSSKSSYIFIMGENTDKRYLFCLLN